jgi:hypothetical protein
LHVHLAPFFNIVQPFSVRSSSDSSPIHDAEYDLFYQLCVVHMEDMSEKVEFPLYHHLDYVVLAFDSSPHFLVCNLLLPSDMQDTSHQLVLVLLPQRPRLSGYQAYIYKPG